ncbi:Glycoside hydrolase family 35 [Penicillium bovifimosum]|uniref:Probable beta-galactosidase B n=1 Tax=Penicillium bovifimosum TaxID=126998 RepID=A0A9W9L1P2_9EURO|nr:Glycoside hydrolase family 35 [Penicillium bovifimosum]KAJ5131389.1 Glycoside hydrolase family 35 [Penicillium bovifimosum]
MPRILNCLLVLLACLGASTQADTQSTTQWPLQDNGLNTVVQWDHYSFQINNQRIFIFSGEFHYWRIPVPGLWRDILEKIKAAGFTAFAFYSNWAYHAPNNETVDFKTGAHDITPIFDLAKELGLYIIVRPGPYVNAEANAGGFPLWLTTGEYGSLRNNDTRYTKAWTPYFTEMTQITSRYQVTDGHNSICYQIENEYGNQWVGDAKLRMPNDTAIAYMELLEANARKNGITVPLTANDPNLNSHSWGKDWSDEGEMLMLLGWIRIRRYCWTCDISQCTSTNGAYVPFQVIDYSDYFQASQPNMPGFMPEFQGGSYNPWGGPEGGCPDDIGDDFANLFYRWNIGQRVTAMSLYMMFGGQNPGAMAAPVTATSYDYSAPISEDRSLWSKYHETKLLALFTRSARDLTMTELVGNGTQYTDNRAVRAYELRNPETNGAFYATFHSNTSLATNEPFHLKVNTSVGALTVPKYASSIQLNGHQSKILVTDFKFGSKTLLYSTAEVLTYAVFDKKPTLVLWVPTGESGEFSIKGAKRGSIKKCEGCSQVKFSKEHGGLTTSFTQHGGKTVLEYDDGVRVIVLDRTTAYEFWAPALTNDPFVPEDESVLVQGPYLVRSAKLSGSKLAITGDVVNATTLEIFAPKAVKSVTWNGKKVHTHMTDYGSLMGSLSAPKSIQLPALTTWKSKDSLPERFQSYDDSGAAWVDANHMTTLNPRTPTTLPVLYADEYGFHNGVRLWRGYFNGTATGAFINVQGGSAFGWSAWLNGNFLASQLGDPLTSQSNLTLSFSNTTLSTTTPNTLLILHDDTGHDETTGALNPRGILDAVLHNSSFTHWRLAGTAGGNSNLDPVRGAYNEDGLYAERLGWHLPGFDDTDWHQEQQPVDSSVLSFTGATVRFFRTTVPLDLPRGMDISISFVLSTPRDSTKHYRAQLFVNGYQYGRYNPHVGNQVVFPVPVGILDYKGVNTLGLAVWAQSEEGASVGVEWRVNYVAESSLDVVGMETGGLRPGWEEGRLRFA